MRLDPDIEKRRQHARDAARRGTCWHHAGDIGRPTAYVVADGVDLGQASEILAGNWWLLEPTELRSIHRVTERRDAQ